MQCAFCHHPIQPGEASSRIAGSSLQEVRAHVRCIPETEDHENRNFREHVSLDDRSADQSKPLKERELREGGRT